MKRLLLIICIVFLICICIPCKSTTNIPLDSIKMSIISFLKEIDRIKDFPIENLPDFLIYDRGKQKAIKEWEEGIFIFQSNLASGTRYHFLLVEQDSFEILNMEDTIDINVLKLVQFFERNKRYSNNDILYKRFAYYLSAKRRIYQKF